MIEVLVTLVIMAFGLLGLAGLQLRLESSEMESYQRSQALLLLDDMVHRIGTNRSDALNYPDEAPVNSPVGVGSSSDTICNRTTFSNNRQRDLTDWCNALRGAGEENSGGSKVGAMLGGRGCIEDIGSGPSGEGRLRVTVVWQGLTPLVAPTETCGENLYNGSTGAACQNDRCRRAISIVIRLGRLE